MRRERPESEGSGVPVGERVRMRRVRAASEMVRWIERLGGRGGAKVYLAVRNWLGAEVDL